MCNFIVVLMLFGGRHWMLERWLWAILYVYKPVIYLHYQFGRVLCLLDQWCFNECSSAHSLWKLFELHSCLKVPQVI